MNLLTEMPYCVSKPGLNDIAGVGNFVVLVEKPEYLSPAWKAATDVIDQQKLLSHSGSSIRINTHPTNESITATTGSKKTKSNGSSPNSMNLRHGLEILFKQHLYISL